MKTEIFIDRNNDELIVKHRKSAIFFEKKANVAKTNSYGEKHKEYVCITELRNLYNFEKEEFERFVDYCHLIAKESWTSFEPKVADSLGSEYDEYYDSNFDNNGKLSIRAGIISIEGPYTQLKSSGEYVRLIKFNKRKFESFVFELNRLLKR